MAKEMIAHSCGHQQEHHLYGKRPERAKRRATLERGLCSDCWHDKLETKRREKLRQTRRAEYLHVYDNTATEENQP